MEEMKEIFSEIALKHLKENYPRTEFKIVYGSVFKDIWVNKCSNNDTYVYLTYFRRTNWYVRVHKRLKNKEILTNQLSILGFEILGDL